MVGHDWGAGLAWALAAWVPPRVERLVVMSVGYERIEGAGHWLQLDATERVNELLLEFLT